MYSLCQPCWIGADADADADADAEDKLVISNYRAEYGVLV